MMSTITNNELVQAVFNSLASHSPEAAANFTKGFLADATYPDVVLQLNHYWRRELVSLDINTIAERECLCERQSAKDWLYNFTNYVLPTVIANNLPRGR